MRVENRGLHLFSGQSSWAAPGSSLPHCPVIPEDLPSCTQTRKRPQPQSSPSQQQEEEEAVHIVFLLILEAGLGHALSLAAKKAGNCAPLCQVFGCSQREVDRATGRYLDISALPLSMFPSIT